MTGNIWFTADLHIGHKNIIRFCDRPFADLKEMHDGLVSNYNAVVKPADDVYILGDFAFDKDVGLKVFNKLNGNKHLILGNHDKPRVYNAMSWAWIKSTYLLKPDTKTRIWLSHYAHRRWPHSHHGSSHLFGHSHGELDDYGKSTDVGVDAWDYKPVSLDEILALMEGKEKTEHHTR